MWKFNVSGQVHLPLNALNCIMSTVTIGLKVKFKTITSQNTSGQNITVSKHHNLNKTDGFFLNVSQNN